MPYHSTPVYFCCALLLSTLVAGDINNTCVCSGTDVPRVPPKFEALPGVRVSACQEAGDDNCTIHKLNVLNESHCWQLCESLTTGCRLFTYNEKLGYCYIYDQDFYTAWTSVNTTDVNWTTYYKHRHDGWKLLYKITKGIKIDAIKTYTTIPGHASASQKILGKDASCGCYVKSQIVDYWSMFRIRQVMMTFVSAGSNVKHVTFSAVGETSTSFFKQCNIISSSWTDLTAWSSVWFLNLNQHRKNHGFLVVKSPYAGCSVDFGWLSVFVQGGPGLGYDESSWPSFAYSPGPNADSLFGNSSYADALMVYAKM